MEFGTVADDLARSCGGQLVWNQIRAGLPFHLKEKWQEAVEDEGQSHDLEGEYFIEHFVEPCPAVVDVDHFYQTVGGVGCASNVCTPFVWVKDRKAFAQQLLEQLTRVAAMPAKEPGKKRPDSGRTAKHLSDEPNDEGEGVWQITTSVVFGLAEGMPLGGTPGNGGTINTTGRVVLNRLLEQSACLPKRDIREEEREHERIADIVRGLSQRIGIAVPLLNPPPDTDDDLDLRLLRAYLKDFRRQGGDEGKSKRSVADWIFIGYQAGELVAVSGIETVDALAANRAFVRANAGFHIRSSGGRLHAHVVRQEGSELYWAVVWFGRLFGRPQPNPDTKTVVGAAVDLFARKFHESIPLPTDPVEVALGAARAALWLGFLNRGLQPPQGRLADFLSEHPELQNWGGSPFVVTEATL